MKYVEIGMYVFGFLLFVQSAMGIFLKKNKLEKLGDVGFAVVFALVIVKNLFGFNTALRVIQMLTVIFLAIVTNLIAKNKTGAEKKIYKTLACLWIFCSILDVLTILLIVF